MGSNASPPVVQIFASPRAGRHAESRVDALARAFEAEGAQVLRGVSASGPPEIAPRATHVCIAGGDGTVRHVASAAVRSGRDVRLSIYPAGTINLLAMEGDYPRRAQDFARHVLADRPHRPHYPVAMGEDHFFACASVGPDSFAVARVSERLKAVIGRLAYAAAAMPLLLSWKRPRIVLTADGREIACEAFYVAKGRYYAGRWSFARDARVDQPRLHVVALKKARRWDYLRFVAAIMANRDVAGLANVVAFSCAILRAHSADPLPIQADGDIVGTLPVTMTVAEVPLSFC